MKAWHRCLFGLVPSIWPEPCPTVVMEAMASGRPVIASKIGGLPDLVTENETGFLVQPDDPVALKLAIIKLLSNPKLLESMGKASKVSVVQFQASNVVPQIEEVYKLFIQ